MSTSQKFCSILEKSFLLEFGSSISDDEGVSSILDDAQHLMPEQKEITIILQTAIRLYKENVNCILH